MARPSKIEPVREFLQKLAEETVSLKNTAVVAENYGEAEIYKRLIEQLQIVLSLCGDEKPKGGTSG